MARKKILLVDDSNTALMTEKMLLRALPLEIITARDGREAVAKAVSERPDVILMDVVMPHMDGLEALKEIRAREETREIPVIMVTTRGEPETIEEGFGQGCTDYVTKPINKLELVTKLRMHLGE